MFPILLISGIGAFIYWLTQPKGTGVVGAPIGMYGISMMGEEPPSAGYIIDQARAPRALSPVRPEGNGRSEPRLRPEEERLMSLLVLFARDKKFEAGRKRYLSPSTALDAVQLARRMNLPRTAEAITTDGPIPDDERIPGRSKSVRRMVLDFGTGRSN
jgi:hypothetical protein